jgi:DNA-binding CsgD family transcriptional regulator
MSKGVMLNRNGQRWMPAVYEALGSSLDVKDALNGGFENLLRMLGADYGAVALAGPGRDAVPDWVVQKHLPPAFLGAYVEMIEHDFLLTETLKQPNIVLRDHQMSTRRDFVRNPFVLRAREVGTPINQVMAVSLIIEGVGMCGLALYRDRARPFTQQEQRMLQQLTPAFANTVRNCRQLGDMKWKNRLHEKALGERSALVLLTSSGKEIDRTSTATTLFETWFPAEERSGGGVPRPLLEMLMKAVAQQARGAEVEWFWTRKDERRDLDLAVSLFHVPPLDTWVMKLKVWGHLPSAWAAKLTKAERRVAAKMILGWDSPLIAAELGSSPRTVETQAQRIRDKLNMVDRKELIRRAMMES